MRKSLTMKDVMTLDDTEKRVLDIVSAVQDLVVFPTVHDVIRLARREGISERQTRFTIKILEVLGKIDLNDKPTY